MYRLSKFTIASEQQQVLQRLSDNAFIPFDPDNTDYQEYLKFLENGGIPLPAENT
jgi:hypothetical protein